MTMPKLPFSLPDIVKYPLHVVVYILLSYFCYKEFTKKDECADLRSIVTAQGKRIETLETKNDNLTYSVAVKSGLIEQLKSQKDSTVRGSENENIN